MKEKFIKGINDTEMEKEKTKKAILYLRTVIGVIKTVIFQ